jgi:hypothetical protein
MRVSSPDTSATASYKEKLLVALHNSPLIVLLDLWEQNILLFRNGTDVFWTYKFPSTGVVETIV